MINQDTNIECTPDLRQIKDDQEQMRWDQMLQGRIAYQWVKHQQEAMGDTATKRKNAMGPMTWATDMIAPIFEHWLKLWKMRNGDRHKQDATTRKAAGLSLF
jgi:hypothetical protein